MSFGFGPGSEMSRAHKRNLEQLKKKPKLSEIHKIYGSEKPKTIKKEEVSPAQLAKFKFDLKEKRKKELKQKILIACLVFAGGTSIFVWLMFF
tara:strand:+ start:5441 stop:5719 length:279 start_codon:yes stop_codon:yes gene_type:complete